MYSMSCYKLVTFGNESDYYSHVLTANHHERDYVKKKKKKTFFESFSFDAHLRGSVSNHKKQALYTETSRLPPLTASAICPTVNQAVRQAPLPYCWPVGFGIRQGRACTHSDVASSVMKREHNHFELLLSSNIPLNWSGKCVCTHNGRMFFVTELCISSGWPLWQG